jgi:hypothetical protein
MTAGACQQAVLSAHCSQCPEGFDMGISFFFYLNFYRSLSSFPPEEINE